MSILELKTNMRMVCTEQDNKYFAKELLLICNGEFQDTNGKINIKNVCISVPTTSTFKINTMVSGKGYFVTNKRASR